MSMEKKIVECVPNFSEGRNMAIIKQIGYQPYGGNLRGRT